MGGADDTREARGPILDLSAPPALGSWVFGSARAPWGSGPVPACLRWVGGATLWDFYL